MAFDLTITEWAILGFFTFVILLFGKIWEDYKKNNVQLRASDPKPTRSASNRRRGKSEDFGILWIKQTLIIFVSTVAMLLILGGVFYLLGGADPLLFFFAIAAWLSLNNELLIGFLAIVPILGYIRALRLKS